MTQTLTYKRISKWMKNGGIHAMVDAYKGTFPNEEALFLEINKENPDVYPYIEEYCDENNKHIGHFEEIALAKQLLSMRKAVVLYGKQGIGKTSIVEQIAKELGYRLIKINASVRIKKNGFPSVPRGILGEKLMILFDEADRMHKKSRDNISCLYRKVENVGIVWNLPVAFTANYIGKFKLSDSYVTQIGIDPLPENQIVSILYFYLKKKGIEIESADRIDVLANECKGDVRGAINSLEIGDIIESDSREPMDVATAVFTKTPSESAEILMNNYNNIKFISMIISENISGAFSDNIRDYTLLCNVDRYKYIISKHIVSNLLSIITKRGKVKLSYPKSYKIKEKKNEKSNTK